MYHGYAWQPPTELLPKVATVSRISTVTHGEGHGGQCVLLKWNPLVLGDFVVVHVSRISPAWNRTDGAEIISWSSIVCTMQIKSFLAVPIGLKTSKLIPLFSLSTHRRTTMGTVAIAMSASELLRQSVQTLRLFSDMKSTLPPLVPFRFTSRPHKLELSYLPKQCYKQNYSFWLSDELAMSGSLDFERTSAFLRIIMPFWVRGFAHILIPWQEQVDYLANILGREFTLLPAATNYNRK
ncbi:hypothetical protein EDB19DRAFT_2022815 [Suillus lakei]|nr:hypothetical protein EDB19DRAFT_2022815 [Suillus lakei]